MVADVTETRNVIPSLEFKTCTTIKLNFIFTLSLRWLLDSMTEKIPSQLPSLQQKFRDEQYVLQYF